MCIHYQGSFCVVRADSTHGSKRKMFSHYHFRTLFASKQSKQVCVLLTLSGLILLTYASHLTRQHLVHSHAHPSQPSAGEEGSLSPAQRWRWWSSENGCRPQFPWQQSRNTDPGSGTQIPWLFRPGFKQTQFSALLHSRSSEQDY